MAWPTSAFEGSHDFKDWWDNFDDFAIPTVHPLLGKVHPGFLDPTAEVVAPKIDSYLATLPKGTQIVVCGHSRGAGCGTIYAGLRTAKGLPMDRLVCWGSPRPGGQTLANILMPKATASYINCGDDGEDYITWVPRQILPEFPYQQPKPLLPVHAEPGPADEAWGAVFKWHHYPLYQRGVHDAALGVAT